MQYTVNRGEKGKIEIKVDVPKAGFEAAYNQVLGEFGKDAQIAGFRPGMAPAEVVEQHVGYNKILNQAASFLISKHLSEIFKKENLVPLESPKIAVETLSKDSPFAFTVTFTQKPKVKVGDWKKVKVTKIKAKEITDKDVEESIKNIFEAWSKQQATRNKKPARGEARHGRQETEEPGTSDQQPVTKFIYDAHGNRIPIKDDKGSPSTDAQDEIDDDFAKAIGARDLAHLREIVKKDLETIVADQVEAKFEQETFEEILKLVEVEVPDILIDDELNRILVRLSSELERQGSDLEKYLAGQKTTIDELKAKWRPQAEKNVKITLLMDEIGRGEKVQVTKEELEQALKGVNETNLTADQKADLERYLVISIFQAKTLDLVKKAMNAN